MLPTLAVGMTCAKRPYLLESIESLRNHADVQEKLHLFCEPGVEPPDCDKYNLQIVSNESRVGTAQNWIKGLIWLYYNVRADYYLMLQDDVIWGRHANVLESTIMCDPNTWPLVGFFSFFTHPACAPDHNGFGWHDAKLHNSKFAGAPAILLTATKVAWLTRSKELLNYKRDRGLDHLLGYLMRMAGFHIMVHQPSICDHIGEISTSTRPKRSRRGHGFEPAE